MAQFFCIFHALSFELNLFFDWRFPLTSEIYERTKNHGKKFLKLCQTSFSGMVHCPDTSIWH